MFDFEKREKTMPESTWHLLIVFQIVVYCCNMILLNNVMDKGFFIIGVILSVAVYYGILSSFLSEDGVLLKDAHFFSVPFVLSMLIVALLMYMQKRMHKEVFMEIKQRVS